MNTKMKENYVAPETVSIELVSESLICNSEITGIGPGYGSDDYGQLSLGDYMMVKSERMAKEAERKNMCWYRTQVRVEPCTHPGYNANNCPYHVHP